ncbi:GTP-binding protein [Alteribacter lacisalsi]|uniref:GTP-binding protein n=1 Tax=Alteribacter lacisalsi TaxID=2045244 RepID=A0A2W0HMF0_9BACI|nr:GTPase [Alteribacter lacisalsi]PYZ98755.1 GTP-binding protein [Alteribacter lacisalsi]
MQDQNTEQLSDELEKQIRDAAEEAFDEEVESVNDQLEKEITFALVGDINTGKSSTVNALMEDELASVAPEPGQTIEVGRYYYTEKIVFVDTPGLDDVIKKNSEQTMKFFRQADVILFFLNAAGTVLSDGEMKVFKKLKRKNNNIIFVLNKIDAVDESEVDGLVQYVKRHTATNLPVIPISSKEGTNVQELREEILDMLKKNGKDLLFARHLRDKSPVANKWIYAAGGAAGTVGLSPIPGSDIVPITGIQVTMMVRLGKLYDKPISKRRAKELAIATVVGNIGRTTFRQAVKVVPVAGSITAAGVAGSLTVALGFAVKYAYEHDLDVDVDTIMSLIPKYYEEPKVKDQTPPK